jgi:hypothetical protein
MRLIAGECQINCVRGFHGGLSSADCGRQTLGKEDDELGVGSAPFDGRLPVDTEIPQRQIEKLGSGFVRREGATGFDDVAQAAMQGSRWRWWCRSFS